MLEFSERSRLKFYILKIFQKGNYNSIPTMKFNLTFKFHFFGDDDILRYSILLRIRRLNKYSIECEMRLSILSYSVLHQKLETARRKLLFISYFRVFTKNTKNHKKQKHTQKNIHKKPVFRRTLALFVQSFGIMDILYQQ